MITPDAEGLHEIANTDKTDRKADIIFVHGLSGSSHSTWRYGQKGQAGHFFWPEELAKDLPQCGIWSLGHASGMSNWFSDQGMALEDRANNLALKLNNRNLGERPIIFITHSMGGLVVKEFVTAAVALGGHDWARIVKAVRGIVFLGTPHHGSHMATVAKGFAVLLRTQEHLQQMKFSGKALDQLHKRFMKWRDETGCCVEAYVETRGITRSGGFGFKRCLPSVVVVPDISGDPKLQRCDCYRVGADHIMLVKPSNVEHDVYAGVLRFITKTLASNEPSAIGTTTRKLSVIKDACESYTEEVRNWLTHRIRLLQEFAKRSDLRTNAGSHANALSAVAASIDGFPGGFYTLDEKGRVVDHLVANHPEMDIRGYNASQREYFIEIRRLHRPIISNCIRSADRRYGYSRSSRPPLRRLWSFRGYP